MAEMVDGCHGGNPPPDAFPAPDESWRGTVGIISRIDEVKKTVGRRIGATRNPGEAAGSIGIKP